LARPFVEAASDLPAAVGGAQSAVLVLDDSFSMSATRGGRTLLDRAKAEAHRLVDALGDSDVALVLASVARDGAATATELTADRARIHRAIDDARPTARATDLTGALRRAARALEGSTRRARRVYLLSDLAAHGFSAGPPWPVGK